MVIVPARSYVSQGSVLHMADTREQKTKIDSLELRLWGLVMESPDLTSSGMKRSIQFSCYTFIQTKLETRTEREINWKIGAGENYVLKEMPGQSW